MSDYPRMQHGFAARNGLLAALLARANYTGIEGVLERPYGGFFSTFSPDAPSKPDARFQSAVADLGEKWETNSILVKPYPLMATLHAPVDCVKLLQEKYKDRLRILGAIKEIKIELGEHSYKHGGWRIDAQPLEVTGAQMSAAYAVALQLVDQEVSPMSFASTKLNRESLFEVINKIECLHRKDFDGSLKTHITISFDDMTRIEETVEVPLGVLPPLGCKEILRKWEAGAGAIVDGERRENIKNSIMKLSELANLDDLLSELRKDVDSFVD